MADRDELKPMFRNIDRHTGRALKHLTKVKRQPKLALMPDNHIVQRVGTGFVFALAAFGVLLIG
ncbi:hypothetical protein [Roseibium sp. RKSG952]|uniref:hypothetical protein n=1 Tax=Roseibium sp. RKSG952 TaxID=2529384 RepID=UPI0012BB6C31|nr:hypothetical protein [Roseibium sp. RKSG952]MTH98311.1 hypothetical protein [Roseibium sp. RKSG952]